jgi:hypothetical protein
MYMIVGMRIHEEGYNLGLDLEGVWRLKHLSLKAGTAKVTKD